MPCKPCKPCKAIDSKRKNRSRVPRKARKYPARGKTLTGKALLGIREFASSPALTQRMGRAVAPSTVTRWGQDGKIVLVAAGRTAKVDVEASLARLDSLGVGKMRPDVAARHTDETAHKAAHGPQTAKPIPNPTQPKNAASNAASAATVGATLDDLPAPTAGGPGKAKYKAIALHFENQTIKLGMALAQGRRYPRQEVRDEANGLGNGLRAAVERLIDQTAPRLAVLPGHLDRGLLLKREVRKIKRLINLEFAGSLRRLRRHARKGKTP